MYSKIVQLIKSLGEVAAFAAMNLEEKHIGPNQTIMIMMMMMMMMMTTTIMMMMIVCTKTSFCFY